MNYRDIIKRWALFLELTEWSIEVTPIFPEQVLYNADVPYADRYFIGIHREEETKEATIFYDRNMSEEDILHELIHLRYPLYTEEEVNTYCNELLS